MLYIQQCKAKKEEAEEKKINFRAKVSFLCACRLELENDCHETMGIF
jgi:hypothetical protein